MIRARWLILPAALVLSACRQDDGRPAVYPVKGALSFKGEAASGAFLVFHPLGPNAPQVPPPSGGPAEPVRPTGLVRPDGTFELTTFDAADGAPAGEYAVTLEWYKPVVRNNAPEAGPNVIPAAYGKPETTPWKVTVKPESNALPAQVIGPDPAGRR